MVKWRIKRSSTVAALRMSVWVSLKCSRVPPTDRDRKRTRAVFMGCQLLIFVYVSLQVPGTAITEGRWKLDAVFKDD